MLGERSLKDAAEELAVPLNRLHYWVCRFMQLGLIRVTRVEKRVGRPVKYYRASARSFLVPPELVPIGQFESIEMYWVKKFWASLETSAPRLLHMSGVRVFVDAEGVMNSQSCQSHDEAWNPLSPEVGAELNTWSNTLYLSRDDAKELQTRLMDLFLQYTQKLGTKQYVIHLGLAEWVND
jgi:hypothetical protein